MKISERSRCEARKYASGWTAHGGTYRGGSESEDPVRKTKKRTQDKAQGRCRGKARKLYVKGHLGNPVSGVAQSDGKFSNGGTLVYARVRPATRR